MPPHPPCRDVIKKITWGYRVRRYKTQRSGVELVRCFDGLVVKTSRCGRDDPGSNPGRGSFFNHIRSHLVVIGQPKIVKGTELCLPVHLTP